jgi:hypothetical protein
MDAVLYGLRLPRFSPPHPAAPMPTFPSRQHRRVEARIPRTLGRRVGQVALLLCGVALTLVNVPVAAQANGARVSEQPIDFDTKIRPILSAKCLSCHGPSQAESGLRLDGRPYATDPADSGEAAIVPHEPAASELLRRVRSDDFDRMPPEGPRVTPNEVTLLERWIEQGASWPEHWAYRPLDATTLPDVPTINADSPWQAWPQNEVDQFVLARLLANGLHPAPPADRRTLIRRLSFDLIGLPPTPEEVDAFIADESDEAYAKVVDRLLNSPRYGERWARHWMDAVHYADSHGFEHDVARESWPYRDYLIRSFNRDTPYQRFVKEQIAGDALYPGDPHALVATGFLATGPWDMSGIQSGNPASLNHAVSQNLDRDDIVTTVAGTLISSTVHCARCHDHKFDPISQADYYSLQAVFAGIDKAHRDYDPDPNVARKRQHLLAEQAALEQEVTQASARLRSEPIQKQVRAWVERQRSLSAAWLVPELVNVSSNSGTQFSLQEDGSLLATGDRPDVDTYSMELAADLPQVTALRLEVLTDGSLPMNGPGRQDNGNLHLNEVKILLQSADAAEPQPLRIERAWADFNQEGWTIAQAIDNNPASAWGIYPEIGKPHQAVFQLTEPISLDNNATLIVQLEQTHGAGHLIGRLRLSLSGADTETLRQIDQLAALPPKVVAAVQQPSESWSAEQELELASYYLAAELSERLAALPPQQKIYCGTNRFIGQGGHQPASSPRTIRILHRGEVAQPRELALPGALSCLPTLNPRFTVAADADESVRRVAFANWLTDKHNVLLWRSIVNRVWQHHFGRGLVDTPNDFGRLGRAPSHPQLLDWMAIRFRDQGQSLKELHRLIVTSATYQQASQQDVALHEAFSERDADNRLLWRMNRRRLDAESFRDALLQVSGDLDLKMFGPPVRHFVDGKKFGARAEANYSDFDLQSPGAKRRSVYRYHYRTMPDPLMSTLDCPSGETLTPTRTESLTPLQALAVLNDRLVIHQAERLANRLRKRSPDLHDQINDAYRLLFGRLPTERERRQVVEYARSHGLGNACRMLLNTNEMMYLD